MNTPNVPDRPRGMKMKDLEEALTEAGFDVGWTVNLHLTRPGSPHIVVETFDETGFPCIYKNESGRDELVQVGGNLTDGIDCLTVEDAVAAAERLAEWDVPNPG